MDSNCDECRTIAEELREAMRESVLEPGFENRWAKFQEMLGPEGDDLPVIGVRRDPAATSASKAYSALRKMDEHHAKTGHKPFSKT